MKNKQLLNKMVKETAIELVRNTKVITRSLATKLIQSLQPAIEEETGVKMNTQQEEFMANLLLEQFEKVYASYGNKDRISEKRLLEGKEVIVNVASAVYEGSVVDGDTALERGEKYCLDVLGRGEMDSFRDRKNETANKVASMIRAIDNPEVYYYLESMLPAILENTISAAKAHIESQDEIANSIDSIADTIVDSMVKDEKVIQLITQ